MSETLDLSATQAGAAEPYELLNQGGRTDLLLLCDHASNQIPPDLAGLGLDEAALCRHIALDIGIAEVTRDMARRLDAPAILSRFSRLLIDPNRPLDDPTLIPQISDDVVIPGNKGLGPAERDQRLARFFKPYHAAIARHLDDAHAAGHRPAIVSLHSFTPVMKGKERPWQIGVLWNEDGRLPLPMIARLRAVGLTVGDNEPYSGRGGHGYTMHRHADQRGLPNVLIEVRQDLIDTHHGAADWALRLSNLLDDMLSSADLRKRGAAL
ncbi:MAG: N-formylglutamate amidohydrolase [Pseudomonadota bacterium]